MPDGLEQRTFRPAARNSTSGITAVLVLFGVLVYVAGSSLAHRDPRDALFQGLIAVGVVAAFAMSLINTRITVDSTWVVKGDWLGRTRRCRRVDLADVEVSQPAFRFIKRDGTVAFKIAQAWWSDHQIADLRQCIG